MQRHEQEAGDALLGCGLLVGCLSLIVALKITFWGGLIWLAVWLVTL
jgi:hypothetical protein